jgi:hypothetical protein
MRLRTIFVRCCRRIGVWRWTTTCGSGGWVIAREVAVEEMEGKEDDRTHEK